VYAISPAARVHPRCGGAVSEVWVEIWVFVERAAVGCVLVVRDE
jgi:hypothetical protein